MGAPTGKRERSAADDRFVIRGKLGSGGMGVVYRAFDRLRDVDVALKTLRHATGRDLYRFKREFRTLADIVHPNLATLYELHTAGDEWFFTMELVEGVPFIQHVRPYESSDGAVVALAGGTPPPAAGLAAPPAARSEPSGDWDNPFDGPSEVPGGTGPTSIPSAPARPRTLRERILDAHLEPARLERALYQLVDGVQALHLAGKLHRDLKPSNVLVDGSGRVVLLDFGLVSDIDAFHTDQTHETSAVGTPAYMSPEQAADRPLTDASDWYSVGVILYEALTGRRPFEGSPREMLRLKQRSEPPPPRDLAPAIPERLDRLCAALLRRDPMQRPDGRAILEALGRQPSAATLSHAMAAAPFVGRDAELAELDRALQDSRNGRCVAVFVRGASGMGKTALVRHFVDEVAAAGGAVVLEGRCYERESVPYKTLDTVVDSLTAHLVRLPRAELDAIIPRDISALARLFPVLRRVPAIAEPAQPSLQPPDPVELRRRAFGALRYLLQRLAVSRPVVISIDDLQWGDADSGGFLGDLVHHPEPPPVLLLCSHRIEDEEQNPLIAALRRPPGAIGSAASRGEVRELTVGALAEPDALRLVAAVRGEGDDDRLHAIVRDAGGSPLFLSELARAAADGAVEAVGLEEVVRARVDRLPEEARALLRVCAVAARPIRSDLARRAAGMRDEGGALATLRAERLVRVRRTGEENKIEPYHDRIREATVGALSEVERRRLHVALAEAIEADRAPDHAALVDLWIGAGDSVRAGGHAPLAAARAEETLAFHRAAALYALALEHGDADGTERRRLQTRMGHVLAHAGRLDDAAAAFATAAEGASDRERLDLKRLELEQTLRRGHLEKGLLESRTVLEAVGVRLPRSRAGAMASLVAQRAFLRLRGLDFHERPAAEIEPAALDRLDVLWSVASGLSFVNPVLGKVLQMRHLRDSLACGEPSRIAMAMTLELGYLGMSGNRTQARAEAIRVRTLALAERLGVPFLTGLGHAAGGLLAFLNGRWRESKDRLRVAERILRDHCTGVRWELDLVEFFSTASLWYLGELRELTRLVPIYVREAEERGDHYSLRGLRGWRSNTAWLAMGLPGDARAHAIAVATPRAPGEAAQLTHYYELLAHGQIDLYLGDAAGAMERVEQGWPDVVAARLTRIQSVKIEGCNLRARCAMGAAAELGPDKAGRRAALLETAVGAMRNMARQKTGWGDALATAVRATLAHLHGDDEAAVALLRDAIAGFGACEMHLHATATRRRLGQVLGGDEGAALLETAAEWMRSAGVADPEAITGMLLPGWRRAG